LTELLRKNKEGDREAAPKFGMSSHPAEGGRVERFGQPVSNTLPASRADLSARVQQDDKSDDDHDRQRVEPDYAPPDARNALDRRRYHVGQVISLYGVNVALRANCRHVVARTLGITAWASTQWLSVFAWTRMKCI
jgi:hypothetical protein